ncbi:MAG: histone deacetylase [Methanobacteriota archaeon]
MAAMRPILYYSPAMGRVDFGAGHPFRGSRFDQFVKLLQANGLEKDLDVRQPLTATDADLALVHTPEYVAHVREVEGYEGALSIDTPVPRGMTDAVKFIVGGALAGAGSLAKGESELAMTFGGFHHAGVSNGEGFCVFNDVAIAARALIQRHEMKRVLVIDTDAHQGNGTMDIFWEDPRVLFISIHQDPRTVYPGRGFASEIGAGEGRGFTINIPMPRFSGNAQWAHALDEIFVPVCAEFKPEAIIRNGGSDPFYADELTELGLDFDGLAEVGRIVRSASDNGPRRLLDLMVSGYGDFVPYGWLALFAGVTGMQVDYSKYARLVYPMPSRVPEATLERQTDAVVAEVRRNLAEFWPCLRK